MDTKFIKDAVAGQLVNLGEKLRMPFSVTAFSVTAEGLESGFRIYIEPNERNCRPSVLGDVREVVANYRSLVSSFLNDGQKEGGG